MIQLDKHYRIERDTASWNLVYEKQGEVNPNTGKPKMSRDVTYHANLKQALVTYLDVSLEGSTDVQSVVAAISAAEERIEKAFDGIRRAK